MYIQEYHREKHTVYIYIYTYTSIYACGIWYYSYGFIHSNNYFHIFCWSIGGFQIVFVTLFRFHVRLVWQVCSCFAMFFGGTASDDRVKNQKFGGGISRRQYLKISQTIPCDDRTVLPPKKLTNVTKGKSSSNDRFLSGYVSFQGSSLSWFLYQNLIMGIDG